MNEREPRRGPGPMVRVLGRGVTTAVVRVPWSWRFLSGPLTRWFDSVAPGWDERVRSDAPEYLEPLLAALDGVATSPRRILDIGTGTGVAAISPPSVLRRGFERRGLRTLSSRQLRLGTYYLAQRV